MDAAQLVKWAVTASLLLIVIGLGLRATFADALSLFRGLFRRPHRLLRSIAAIYGVVPLAAVVVVLVFDVPPPVKVALLAMAISPLPPLLPGKQMKFGGRASHAYGLLVAIALVAIVVAPLAVDVLGWLFRRDLQVGTDAIARTVAMSVLAPLAVGLTVRWRFPGAAERMAPWVTRSGTALLVVAGVLILINAWPAIVSLLGSGAVVAFAVVSVVAVAAGHLLGGPDPAGRTVLAIASPMRHPGVALVIARATFPDDSLAPAAILLFLLVGVVVTSVYGKLRLRASRPAPERG
ncbi:MAG: Na+-dependent transporter [Proteobacteria bacterium]|jgi:BASS family bile acid:Na+ symporter|nr:Na+-dependent transporter [Pseudomonadota bacterium]